MFYDAHARSWSENPSGSVASANQDVEYDEFFFGFFLDCGMKS
jgi:hypothetical protein